MLARKGVPQGTRRIPSIAAHSQATFLSSQPSPDPVDALLLAMFLFRISRDAECSQMSPGHPGRAHIAPDGPVSGSPVQPVATGGSTTHSQGASLPAPGLAYPEGPLRRRLVRRAALVAEKPRHQRQRTAGKASGSPSRAVQRRPAADPAAQGEGLARRHDQEAGLHCFR